MGGEPERACIADLIFCHGIQTVGSSRICHCCCFISMVSKNFVQPFLRSRKLLRYTHASSQIVMSWITGAYVIIHDPYLKRTQLLCVIWRHRLWQPALACHCSQLFSVDPSAWSSFTEHEFGFSTCANLNLRSFNLNFWYMAASTSTSKQASRHTHAHAQCSHAIVWGLPHSPQSKRQQVWLFTHYNVIPGGGQLLVLGPW